MDEFIVLKEPTPATQEWSKTNKIKNGTKLIRSRAGLKLIRRKKPIIKLSHCISFMMVGRYTIKNGGLCALKMTLS